MYEYNCQYDMYLFDTGDEANGFLEGLLFCSDIAEFIGTQALIDGCIHRCIKVDDELYDGISRDLILYLKRLLSAEYEGVLK